MRKWIFAGLLTTVLLTAMAQPSAETKVYRCTDPDGEITFAQHPCPSSNRERELSIDHPETGWVPPKPGSDSTVSKRRSRPSKRPARATGAEKKRADQCWKKRRQLDEVNWQLRRGYKAGKGVKLRRKRTAHEDYIRRFCSR